MAEQFTFLFVGAHPDDETFGPGGTLAEYARRGVKVFYICATRGEAGEVDVTLLEGYNSIGDLRWAELECAARELGLTGVIHLGYRDSGMAGSPDNLHAQALAGANPDQVTERILGIMRQLQPQVVVTFDPQGGYRHPDHLAVHRSTVQAFNMFNTDTSIPRKLYFHVFPKGFLKVAVKILPLFGQNPRHFGRNRDIDLTALIEPVYPTHATVRFGDEALERRERARQCHRSQLGGGSSGRGLLSLVEKVSRKRDSFMRAYPPPSGKAENDLFAGI